MATIPPNLDLPMRLGFACLAVSALLVAAFWFWLGLPIAMPQTPLQPGERLYCLSYAPFRGAQSPFDPAMHIPPEQIDDDMARLARITDCVRTYSVELGQDQVPAIAKRHGLKVIQGIWLGTNAEKNRAEIETAVRLANEFPDVIRALVVGNEVLLRGDLSADDLAASIRAVKARVKVPATYADVWEYWLRNAQVASAVDFVTIHILPYWEDFPIAAANAAAHVDAIRKRVAAAMAGKDVIIGEVGWPSEGRMREGALPSPANQARVIQDVLALASRENFRVNVIEAFDQPWKRALEGTVGGYWGLLDAGTRDYKFAWGQAVSNHPQWKLQAAGGVAFVIVIFASAFLARRREMSAAIWLAVTANALAGGAMIGWCIADVPMQSFDAGGWLRNVALTAVAFLTPPVLSAATIRGTSTPPFWRVIGPLAERARDPLVLAAGLLLIAVMLLALQSALGLVFDPRYRDFPFAPLTAAAVPFLTQHLMSKCEGGGRSAAEFAGATLLALSVPYIVINETFANWQSLWLCACFAALAFILARARDGRS
jgi:exo-beta-1,3-glucanase (GH17 family)